jgi:inosine/xanthosine triphosphate pyrophosphatase family protein
VPADGQLTVGNDNDFCDVTGALFFAVLVLHEHFDCVFFSEAGKVRGSIIMDLREGVLGFDFDACFCLTWFVFVSEIGG